MKTRLTFLLLLFFLAASCIKKENNAALTPVADSVEGTYIGYRSQQNGGKAANDSTQITLKVSRLSATQVQILQTSPNEFRYLVTMQDNRFTYDLGITEAACGAARIVGEGTFKGKELYLLETQECTRALSAAKIFTHLRATKQ